MEHQGRTAIVTGGSKGIGAASVEVFAREGANVIILDVDEAQGNDVASKAGEKVVFIKCDVSKEQEVKAAIAKGVEKFGQINYLVSNAGIQRYSTVTETSEEEWDLVMDINLKSAFLCAKHAIPHMQKIGKGVVVNVSSVQAMISQGNVCPYVTSKTAMIGLTRSIAVDYGPQVRCVAVCPGSVDTPMLRWGFEQSPDPEIPYQECVDMHLTKRIAQPIEVGEFIAYLCSDKAAFMTGQAYRIDGGLGVMIPGSKR
ncbi:NAD(P)-dependent dehydrogenase (short-subunit alcohol dehydrogenase family) [Catalinimonas alkaloidigena]|uniref:SDR family NAD(P)-dependent oxidoreductase n=1 Tax=Catalinimonas alkaloidigena TaxID=1075417 RepID=UPI00240645BD|nr:glucose 1-dehydrogenase [Catalinimonas alkaloidigena]MDF9799930.1 NAD(P)-dependent dehydrogenase (short-subunit alcohol dehydrogenase family) [Catalinimonas alkaloidigena]